MEDTVITLYLGENSVINYLVLTTLLLWKIFGSDCQYLTIKSWKMMLNQICTIPTWSPLSSLLTPCFYFVLLAWLLRTMILLGKLENRPSKKNWEQELHGKKFRKVVHGLNHAPICNPDFIWMRSANKTVHILKTLFSIFKLITLFEKTTWFGTVFDDANKNQNLKTQKNLFLIIKIL